MRQGEERRESRVRNLRQVIAIEDQSSELSVVAEYVCVEGFQLVSGEVQILEAGEAGEDALVECTQSVLCDV